MLVTGDADFVDEMAIEPVGDGRYLGRVSRRFNAPVMPQGGVTTSLALVAAAAELDRPDQRLVSSNTVFAGMVPPGDVEVEVVVLRRGRGASQVLSTIRPREGDPAGHVVTATFAARRETILGFEVDAPLTAPPPEECSDPWEGPRPAEFQGPRPPFFDHFENGRVSGHVPWDDPWPTDGPTEVVGWTRWKDTPRDADGGVSPLALVTCLDMMPPAVFEQHGKQDRAFLVPSVDLAVQIYRTTLADDGWMLRRNTSKWAGEGLAQAAVELFDREGRRLAWGAQLMHVRPVDWDEVRSRIEAQRDSAASG